MSHWREVVIFSSWKLLVPGAILYLMLRPFLPKSRRKGSDTAIACLGLIAMIGYFLLANPYILAR